MTEHEASAAKLRKARQEGNSGISTVATTGVAFFVAAAVVPLAGERAGEHVIVLVKAAVASAGRGGSVADVGWASLAGELVSLTAPPLLAVAASAALVSGIQAGGVFAVKRVFAFKWDIAKGFQSLVSPSRLFGVVRSLVAAMAAGWLVYRALHSHARDIVATTGRLEHVVPVAFALVKGLVWDVALLGLALGGIDTLITRLQWKKGLRMKDEEVKREHRESQGDPEIKAARMRVHHEMLKAAAVHKVKDATMVLTTRRVAS